MMISEDAGERELQREMGSYERASKFYDRQMKDRLSVKMVELIGRQEMVFMATADAQGQCDCSPRFGKRGFVRVIDEQTLAFPDYRGNGVFASLGNILENPNIGLVFIDFFDSTVGLHVNGKAQSYQPAKLPEHYRAVLQDDEGRIIERWVVISIEEAYIHCSKHVPKLARADKTIDWGTDDPVAKATDYFEKQDCSL